MRRNACETLARTFRITAALLAAAALTLSAGEDGPAQAGAKPGLLGEFYQWAGELKDFPNLDGKTPTKTAVTPKIDFPNLAAMDKYVEPGAVYAQWTGVVRIIKSGHYKFAVASDDGAAFYLDGKLLIDNGGLHGMQETEKAVKLDAGDHAVKLAYFNAAGDGGVRLLWQAPGGGKETIPEHIFFHNPPAGTLPNPYLDEYASYRPDFVGHINGGALQRWRRDEKQMELSSEKTFYTLNIIDTNDRANALVDAGIQKEREGQFREALKIYKTLFDSILSKTPNVLYRVSQFGVYVPVAQYVQRRILNFPKPDLAFYRTMFDARAKESYEQARRQYSLIGLSEVVDSMLATSYGDNALFELGNAALDTGHYLAALENFRTIRDFFPESDCRNAELDLKIALCEKMLGVKDPKIPAASPEGDGGLSGSALANFRKVLNTATYTKPPFHSQFASAPNVAADDYTLLPPSADPLAIQEPVWIDTLPGSRKDFYVFSQPLVAANSVVYRHKNIIYSRSLLNGELRWTNDLGGRAVWQNGRERMYPEEDVLVQDGLVFTPMFKVGPSLVALDEVTGQLKWAYGPIAASTIEESRMRFEAAPAGGPRTVFATYVLDNIEGETHTDSEYGVIAFDSATGRIRWRSELCRLQPGKFSGGFAEKRRNRIRSFTSPPLYHEGTVYVGTNAGAVAALDALSGRIKWLMRYPYNPGIHDATRPYTDDTLYFNQRPLLVGELLYLLPVDSYLMLCLDRGSGKIVWSRPKLGHSFHYFLGPISTGELVWVTKGRNKQGYNVHWVRPPIELLDPKTGQTTWKAPDLIAEDDQPVMKYYIYGKDYAWMDFNIQEFDTAARPFLDGNDTVYITQWRNLNTRDWMTRYVFHLAAVDLKNRKIVHQRRYLTGGLLAALDSTIRSAAPNAYKAMSDLPHKDKNVLGWMAVAKEVMEDRVPENEHGPFMPFSRLTFDRYGTRFELRFGPREVQMVYDRDAVRQALAKRNDPEANFANAELALGESRLDEAAALLKGCLEAINPEDLDFRAMINQQLFRVHKRVARSGIRAGVPDKELANALGMSRTASTLAEEIETLFALSEAYQRKGDLDSAARCLRSIIAIYGHHEYPIPGVANAVPEIILQTALGVMDKAGSYVKNTLYSQEMGRALNLLKKGLPLYLSTVSPLPKNLTVRAGEYAARRLASLQKADPEFGKRNGALAADKLVGRSVDEQMHRIWEFPATETAQKILAGLFESSVKEHDSASRLRLWQLADAARVSGLEVPEAYRKLVTAPPPPKPDTLPGAVEQHVQKFEDAEGTAWMIVERNGDRAIDPQRLFLAGRVKKKLDNRFLLHCWDLKSGEKLWEASEPRGNDWFTDLRLRGTGQEPGFFEAFCHGDLVVVHGLFDVLAFNLKDGKLRWRFQVPFDFEIKHAVMSGDLLVLAGKAETLALYLPTNSPAGEVAWQEKEAGDLYDAPYFHGDRLVEVRKLPFNVTVRYRATGKLIGRLELPDLSLSEDHPLFENGPAALPLAHFGKRLLVTDTWYYISIDVERLAIEWKRLIDANDATREPPLRFALNEKYLNVLKEDYDVKVCYQLDAKSGQILWKTEPKDAKSPQPLHSVILDGETVYGLGVHPGQGFFVVAREAATGKLIFNQKEEGYQEKPKAALLPRLYGNFLVALVQDRQDMQLRVFDAKTGKGVHKIELKGVGPFGEHGRMSATVQGGRPAMMNKEELRF